jgi:hypothetical protein
MNLEAEKKLSCGKVTLFSPDEHKDTLKKTFLEATDEDERVSIKRDVTNKFCPF